MYVVDCTRLGTINHRCFLNGSAHRPILVVINVEVGIIVLTPTFLHTMLALHIDEVLEFLSRQRALILHDILMWSKWHRLCKRPFAAGYHRAQLVVVQFVIHWMRIFCAKVTIILQIPSFLDIFLLSFYQAI